MQSPSIWPATLDTIKEGSMAVVQQALPEDVTMTICGEALTRQRDSIATGCGAGADRSGSGDDLRPCRGIRTVVKLANSVAAWVGRSVMAHVFIRRPSEHCPKSIVWAFWRPWGNRRGSVMPGACQSRMGGSGAIATDNAKVASYGAPGVQRPGKPIVGSDLGYERHHRYFLRAMITLQRGRQNGACYSRSSSCRSSVLPTSDNSSRPSGFAARKFEPRTARIAALPSQPSVELMTHRGVRP